MKLTNIRYVGLFLAAMLLAVGGVFAQVTVSGTVVDSDDGSSIPGVNM